MLAKKNTWILILTGFIVSLAFTVAYVLKLSTFMYAVFPLLVGLLFALSFNGRNNLLLLGSSFFVALILSLPFRGSGWAPRHINVHVFYPLMIYFVHCFHYAYHHNGNNWNLNYALLFQAAWNTLIVLLFAIFFMFASFELIYGASLLFISMDSHLLYNFMDNTPFIWSFLMFFLLFIGIGIAQNNIKAVHQLRFILLTCMYYFLPFLVFTSVVLFILFWTNTDQNPNVIISAFFDLIVVSILFLNAYYQDGRAEKKKMVWLDVLLRGYKVLLLIMILITCYYAFSYMSLALIQLISLTITLFLGWTYAYSAFFSDKKAQQIMEDGNKYWAIVFIVAIYVAILPYSPLNFIVNKDKSPLSILDGTDVIRKYGRK